MKKCSSNSSNYGSDDSGHRMLFVLHLCSLSLSRPVYVELPVCSMINIEIYGLLVA